jgi:hypothetical protein
MRNRLASNVIGLGGEKETTEERGWVGRRKEMRGADLLWDWNPIASCSACVIERGCTPFLILRCRRDFKMTTVLYPRTLVVVDL